MKKDKKWFVDKWTEERDKSAVHDPMYHFINEFITDVKELDEPEALSKEWVNNNVVHVRGLGDIFEAETVENLLVPKQGLPVIPKYVADWIKDLKSKGINMLESIYDFNHGEDINNYMREQGDVLMRAWLDGFTIAIEEEPLYYALVKGHELSNNEFKYWSCKAYNSGHLFVGSKYPKASCINRITKNNWNELGINESNADFVKVEEME